MSLLIILMIFFLIHNLNNENWLYPEPQGDVITLLVMFVVQNQKTHKQREGRNEETNDGSKEGRKEGGRR